MRSNDRFGFNCKSKLKTRTLAEAPPKPLRSLSETLRLTSLLKSLKNNLLPLSRLVKKI